MTSEVKTEARFGLSGPDYLHGPDFEAVFGPVEPVDVVKKQKLLQTRPRISQRPAAC